MNVETVVKTRREQDLAAALTIDGWLSDGEAGTLYDLARTADGPIVEIGSWQGRSTAALALGGAAGHNPPVYAIDSFKGVPPTDRLTNQGQRPGWQSSTPALLRDNLNHVGVNGQVRIIAKPSAAAVADVPAECSLIFIDGDHAYDAVCRDLDLYMPKVKLGGKLVLHDVVPSDAGVVRAVDEKILPHPQQWRALGRADSAVVFERCQTESCKVALGCPGRSFGWGTMLGVMQASLGANEVQALNSGTGWDDFNAIWAQALNLAAEGAISHFAMLHSDVVPQAGWLDVLMGEITRLQADLVSVAIPIKDRRGVTSSGLGDLANRWSAWRRLTVRELLDLPETFGLADLCAPPDKYLLHNTGCWVADLRRSVFTQTDDDGNLLAFFNFPTRISKLPNGNWAHGRESEDWFWSRQLHALDAKTFITRKVRLEHLGEAGFPNYEAWGKYRNGDEDTKPLWNPQASPTGATKC